MSISVKKGQITIKHQLLWKITKNKRKKIAVRHHRQHQEIETEACEADNTDSLLWGFLGGLLLGVV